MLFNVPDTIERQKPADGLQTIGGLQFTSFISHQLSAISPLIPPAQPYTQDKEKGEDYCQHHG